VFYFTKKYLLFFIIIVDYCIVMSLKRTTPIPNVFFEHIPHLTHAELRVLLVVIRQTYGWLDVTTGKRKIKDRLTYNFIIKRTGLYRTILSKTIQQLVEKRLLLVTNSQGTILATTKQRRGNPLLFYEVRLVRDPDNTSSLSGIRLIRDSEHNKRNTPQRKTIQKKTNRQQANLRQLHSMIHDLAEQKQVPPLIS